MMSEKLKVFLRDLISKLTMENFEKGMKQFDKGMTDFSKAMDALTSELGEDKKQQKKNLEKIWGTRKESNKKIVKIWSEKDAKIWSEKDG